ncbi:iron chelate uptake ABC transporter family permease subunit [Microbacterium sp. NC79]|uniref:iron chelate uptake ABC transporter family permease subunit n=1 Tax=Microbacterium sp. NC79 TaxID=2851009 RepID=UPI00349F74FD
MAEVQVAGRARRVMDAETRRWAKRITALAVVAVITVVLVLTWNITVEPFSAGFYKIVEMRLATVVTIILVACCQAVAVVLFHTATGNRILTPSIMGFESLYVVIQTAMVFFFGVETLNATDGVGKVLVQSAIMVAFATVLYGWLFGGKFGNLHITLLVGLVLGTAFGTLSAFMQRMLVPADFDILSARLFGSIANSNPEYLPVGFTVLAAALFFVFGKRHRLDVLALGRETSINLGLSYKREVLTTLILVAVLISISTSLVGPMTFFGFIVATLAYQLAGSQQHRHVIPFAMLLGVVTLLGSYFVLHHIFRAAGLVTVIIEFVGGILFVILLLRKGSL